MRSARNQKDVLCGLWQESPPIHAQFISEGAAFLIMMMMMMMTMMMMMMKIVLTLTLWITFMMLPL